MKNSRRRKEAKKREKSTVDNQKEQPIERKQPLRLVSKHGKTLIDRQEAMVEKIWDDLIENYSYIDDNTDRPSTKDIEQREEFSRHFKPAFQEQDDENTDLQELSLDSVLDLPGIDTISNEHLRFTKAVQLSQSFVLIIDKNGVIEYANPHFQNISGYTQSELYGKDLGCLISDLASNEEYEQIKLALKNGITWKGELVNAKKNGEWYIFMARISPIKSTANSVEDYIVVGHDVTSFRETEIKLEQAVEDKTILLSELHHRVKNNLAIISGIMQLQAFEETDEYLKNKLFSSVGRIKTLASMHELLYESTSFTMLEFGTNVYKIVESVQGMFDPEQSLIEVEYALEPILLNINQAHPCALIINEVITNTFRKAQDNPELKSCLIIKSSTYGKKVLIEIKDNLDSIPEGYSARKQPLSLQLIKTLVRQLNAQFNYLSDDYGTLFTLSFEKANTKGAGNVRLG